MYHHDLKTLLIHSFVIWLQKVSQAHAHISIKKSLDFIALEMEFGEEGGLVFGLSVYVCIVEKKIKTFFIFQSLAHILVVKLSNLHVTVSLSFWTVRANMFHKHVHFCIVQYF